MRQVSLTKPYEFVNGFVEITPAVEEFISKYDEINSYYQEGKPLYFEFISGDRKGSIAEYIPDGKIISTEANRGHTFWLGSERKYGYRFTFTGQYGKWKWTDKSYKPKAAIHYKEVVWLPDYKGPTIWSKIDADAEKKNAIENNPQYDIKGNILECGDRVFYINARYSHAARLSHGVIHRFTATRSGKHIEIFTRIVEDNTGRESSISNPKVSVYKIDGKLNNV